MQVFDACWERETTDVPVTYPKGQEKDTIRAQAQRMIEQFLASKHAVPEGEIIGLQETFRVVLAEDLPDLMGRVDVLTHNGSELLITDVKAARSMWTAETANDNSDQLVLYSLGMEDLARTLDAAVQLRFVIVTKTKEPRVEAVPVEVDPDRISRTRAVVERVIQAMQYGVVYPSPSQINCSTCPFQQQCEGWHRLHP